jgi:hypothetical protein
MVLSPVDTELAKTTIREAFVAVMKLPTDIDPCVRLEKWKTIVAKRDSVLLSLVRTQADSSTFEKRAAPQGPKGPCPYRS